MEPLSPPARPAAHAEKALVTAILQGHFPPGTNLPAERELAGLLGVTRPTLREALRRLESDGWLQVQHGKATRVKDFWREGGLNVLSSIVRYSEEIPPDFVQNLLQVRCGMAPDYVRKAVDRSPQEVVHLLSESSNLEDTPEAYGAYDWKLHNKFTVLSGNPIYTLILNGFSGFYEQIARLYFSHVEARQASRDFYAAVLQAAQENDPQQAERIARSMMQESIHYWQNRNQTNTELLKFSTAQEVS
jgi:GntR family transcriptional regulator, negative regulator for fad regulon and positive regulator of fabA